MIPYRIHQFWAGPDRPEDIRQMMISVREKHLGWEIRVWNEDNIKDLGLNFDDLMDKCQNFASVSNVVRLHAVYQLGGLFLDADVEVLKPMDRMLWHRANAAFQDEKYICNAIFSAEAGHPWLKAQIDRQDYLMNGDAARGPYAMTEAPREGLNIVPTNVLYPFHFDTPKGKWGTVPSEAICIHHWKGSWSSPKS